MLPSCLLVSYGVLSGKQNINIAITEVLDMEAPASWCTEQEISMQPALRSILLGHKQPLPHHLLELLRTGLKVHKDGIEWKELQTFSRVE